MKSMTGCGTGKVTRNAWEVTVELKTVNHRYLDLALRLPRTLAFLESALRDGISAGMKRGHVEIFVTVRNTDQGSARVEVSQELAESYFKAAQDIAWMLGKPNDLTVSQVLKMEGVATVTENEMDQETVLALCSEATAIAVAQVNEMRQREGDHLREDLSFHLNEAEMLRQKIMVRAPQLAEEYRARLNAKLESVLNDAVDSQRLAQEVAIMADRCAIDEELSRLESHYRQMTKYLQAEGEIGKKMDFLIQEMNREANTIGSKASDAVIAQMVVDLKSEIEKLREQIQNVE